MRQKNQDTFAAIEAYIHEFVSENGYCPTVREISAGIGVPKATTHRYMEQMREAGTIDYSGYRNITTNNTRTETIRVPVLGAVSCGIPKYAEENIEEYVRLPVSLFGKGSFFLLRAYGDS
ncbi:MAG: helix-turn-helix domain-containing protein, partial [Clostridia bacterium]|nr:helix-turn-helix domain-containing protein [Clostridia bacterium]